MSFVKKDNDIDNDKENKPIEIKPGESKDVLSFGIESQAEMDLIIGMFDNLQKLLEEKKSAYEKIVNEFIDEKFIHIKTTIENKLKSNLINENLIQQIIKEIFQ